MPEKDITRRFEVLQGSAEPVGVSGKEYIDSFAGVAVSQYMELGFDPSFAVILGKHISDWHLTLDQSQVTGHESYLSLSSYRDGSNMVWERQAVIGVPKTKQLLGKLALSYKATTGEESPSRHTNRLLNNLAVDWSLFELSADAAAISVYMQRKFDRYVPDYNGQRPNFRADLAISENVLAGCTNKPLTTHELEADHNDFRAGIALILMHDAVLINQLMPSAAYARMFIHHLRSRYPNKVRHGLEMKTSPFSSADIMQRLSAVEPRKNIMKEWAEYALLLDGQS